MTDTACIRIRNEDPEKVKQQKIRYYSKHKHDPSYIAKRREIHVKSYLTKPEYHMCRQAKYNSKTRGILFDLVPNDIVIPTHCKYLGIELTRIVDDKMNDSNMSLDRIDSSKGYTKDNIQVISIQANQMKNNASVEQLITFAQNVLKLHGQ